MDGRSILASNIRRLRLGSEISQEELAENAGISRAYMSRLELKRASATVDVLDKLAKALKVDLKELFSGPEKGARGPKALPVGRKPSKGR